jgi:hypothetical protein
MAVVLLTCRVPSFAQDRDDAPPRPDEVRLDALAERFEFWVRAQGLFFGNFFQATEGREEDDVSALLGEVGTSARLTRSGSLAAYGSVNYLAYQEEGLDSSHGFRVGMRGEARPHAFDVYYDQQMDRPTFDVGDVFDRADVRRIAAEYSNRVTRRWQVTLDGEAEDQEFDLTPNRDNEFAGFGAAVRYRGWRRLSPEIGYRVGDREVADPTQSYDQSDLYLQLRSPITPAIYASVRLRSRARDYSTGNTGSSNFGRKDDRIQLSGYVDLRLRDPLTLNLYGSREDVDSNLPGRDFATTLFAAGVTYRF